MSMLAASLSDEERYAELIRLLNPNHPFMQLGHHFGEKSAPTSRIMRVVREGKNFIKKEYLGPIAEKTAQEIELLMAAAAKGLRHTATFKTVHAKTCNLDDNCAAMLELLMKNYGLDLEDWAFLFRQGGLDYFGSPYFHLAIWNHVLSAMKELHLANFVQVDVKAENICVALPAAEIASPSCIDRISLKFDLRELTLIDLGEALHPNLHKRTLLFHPSGIALGPTNDYISRHYVRQKALVRPDDMKPLRCLDWRVDFYALGCAVDEWNSSVQFARSPPDYLSRSEKQDYGDAIDVLKRLPAWLQSKDTDPSTEAGELPHDALLAKIGAVLNLKKWEALAFTLPMSIDRSHCGNAASAEKSMPQLMPGSGAARETLIEGATDASRSEPKRENQSAQFNSGMQRRINRRVTKSNVEAVDWYRKVEDRRRVRRFSVDLFC